MNPLRKGFKMKIFFRIPTDVLVSGLLAKGLYLRLEVWALNLDP